MSNHFRKATEIRRLLKEGKISCGYCKPNRNENSKKRNKKYSKSWKVKTKNKRQFTKIDKEIKLTPHSALIVN